jgi:site-specific DNA recombinase
MQATAALLPCLGYARVSTERQVDQGVSLEAQEAAIRGYASLHGLQLAEILVDRGFSGKRADNRPALQEALKRLRAGKASGLITLRLDRLTRSVIDAVTFLDEADKRGWRLHSINERLDTGSAMGRFVCNLLASLGQLEREQIGERTRAALRHKQGNGEFTGGRVPYGQRLSTDGVKLELEPTEQAVLCQVREWRAEGLSLRAIARQLGAQGTPSKTGRPWSAEALRQLLGRQVVA